MAKNWKHVSSSGKIENCHSVKKCSITKHFTKKKHRYDYLTIPVDSSKSDVINAISVYNNHENLILEEKFGRLELHMMSLKTSESMFSFLQYIHTIIDDFNIAVQIQLHRDSDCIDYLVSNEYRLISGNISFSRRRELGEDEVYTRLSRESRRAVCRKV